MSRAGAFLRDRRGVAAVEFALLLPVMALLYFGAVELTQGLMTQQRVAHTASAIGDLAAQSSSVTSSGVSDFFTAGQAIMYPYATTTLGLRISSLTADASGNVTVAWSQASGTLAALTKGSSVASLPSGVISAGGSVIMAESKDTYSSAFGELMPTSVVFNEVYYLTPRASTQVTCADC
jgi:Flp pilus assembly protein TadG